MSRSCPGADCDNGAVSVSKCLRHVYEAPAQGAKACLHRLRPIRHWIPRARVALRGAGGLYDAIPTSNTAHDLKVPWRAVLQHVMWTGMASTGGTMGRRRPEN